MRAWIETVPLTLAGHNRSRSPGHASVRMRQPRNEVCNAVKREGSVLISRLPPPIRLARVCPSGVCPLGLWRTRGVFWRAWLGRLAAGRATAALEFALASPLLVVMLGGAADFGLAQFYRVNLANAVAAGAQYALLTGPAVGTGNIQTIVTDAMYLPAGASGNLLVTVTGPGGSSSPGGGCLSVSGSPVLITSASYGSPCGDGSTAGTYVLITATYTSIGLMNGFMSSLTHPITESATVRVN
jgi:hypothetical protein